MSKARVSLDPKFFPHLCDIILGNLELEHLIPLRGVCAYFRERVEPMIARHIVITNVNKRAMPALPLKSLPRFPRQNFWQSKTLKDAVTVVDYSHHTTLDKMSYPKTLGRLSVDIVRDMDGVLESRSEIPVPATKEWISFIGFYDFWGKIPDTVSERIVLVFQDRPGDAWELMLPDKAVEIVIIFHGWWWDVDVHDDFPEWCSHSSCLCGECDECLPCSAGLCTACNAVRDDAINLTFEMVDLVAARLKRFPVEQGVTVTLVDLDDFFIATTPFDVQGAHEHFIELLTMEGEREVPGIEEHLEFVSLDDYRKSVGEERYRLQTYCTYYCD